MATKLHYRKQLFDRALLSYSQAYGLVDDGDQQATSSSPRRCCRIGLIDDLFDLRRISRTARARAQVDADLARLCAEQSLAMQKFDADYAAYRACCTADGVDHSPVGHDACSCDACSALVARLCSREPGDD